jgi:hypothetical protein
MIFRIAADAVLLLHLAFILFVVLGGYWVMRRPWIALIHIPAAFWGAFVELAGWFCPLTDLENYFLHRAGLSGYADSFIGHYLTVLIYPEGLTRNVQLILGAGVILVNILIYGIIICRITSPLRNKY